MAAGERDQGGRGASEWVLLALCVEKVLQHAFITWAFVTDRFDLREQVAPPYEWLLVSGGAVAILFAIAFVGLWQRERWALPLLTGLAVFDIVGEFVGQGTLAIEIVVSFLVAILILLLSLRLLRRRLAA